MSEAGFQYLNLNNVWTNLQLQAGLVQRSDGAITLAPIPQIEATIAQLPPAAVSVSGAANLDADADGNLYFADPSRDRILRWDACTGDTAALSCFGGTGSLPGQLRSPRGVLVLGQRLYVADSGNHRIQIIDLSSLQLLGIWGQLDPYAPPIASDAPGQLNDPWDLIADAAGDIYVLDRGNRRIQKFTTNGRLIPEFAAIALEQPLYLCMAQFDGQERLLILDLQSIDGEPRGKLLVYQLDGTADEAIAARWQSFALQQPTGLVATADTLYVGAGDQILGFDLQGKFLGAARGYRGSIAGLSLDRQGRVLVHPGGGGAVMRLIPAQAFGETGSFLAGAFHVDVAAEPPTRWFRLRAIADPLPPSCHLQFFTYTSPVPDPPTDTTPILESLNPGEFVPIDTWSAAPLDGLDLLILNQPAPYLWIKGIWRSDGTASPVLHQMRLEYNSETWLRHLPAIYQRGGSEQVFLERFLALFENLLSEETEQIDRLPQLFDRSAAPDRFPHDWLDWLAGWLAFDLDETWSEPQRRQAIADAFSLYSQRGTVTGLKQLIRLYTGAIAHIEEPARFASLWSLGDSTLGFTTMLAPGDAQGAVVGTTATLNQTHLIQAENYGAPLFEDVAHRFCVQVYAADVDSETAMVRVQQVLDHEKPAHTTYQLCAIEAQLRVGLQARLGIDAIVGAPPPDLVLTEAQQLGVDTVLAPLDRAGSQLGQSARLDRHTSLQ